MMEKFRFNKIKLRRIGGSIDPEIVDFICLNKRGNGDDIAPSKGA